MGGSLWKVLTSGHRYTAKLVQTTAFCHVYFWGTREKTKMKVLVLPSVSVWFRGFQCTDRAVQT